MRKPNVIQVAAGTTLALSMGANAWYGIDEWDRGGFALILAGVWMPVAIVLLERIMHALDLSRGATYGFRIGLFVVAVFCMYYSMSHLAHVATPNEPTSKERFDGWIVAISVDVVMVLSGLALMMSKHKATKPAAEVIERVVEKIVEVPVEVEKIVYVEAPQPEPQTILPFEMFTRPERAELEETETITETRQVTRTRRSSLTAEQQEQIVELGLAGHKPAEILRKLGIEGKQTNYITRSPAWARVLELRG